MPDAGASVTPSRPEAAAEAAMPSVRGARRSVGAEEDGAIRAVTVTVSAEGNCGGTAANCGASGTRDATLALDTVRAIQQNAPLALRRGSRAAKGTRL